MRHVLSTNLKPTIDDEDDDELNELIDRLDTSIRSPPTTSIDVSVAEADDHRLHYPATYSGPLLVDDADDALHL